MIDLLTVPAERLNQTMRLLQAEFRRRGWRAEIPYTSSPHCFITRTDGTSFHIFSAAPPTTTYAYAHLADDKFATYQLLRQSNVPQLETKIMTTRTTCEEIEAFISRVGAVVVKPSDDGHGRGITVGLKDFEGVQKAFAYARSVGRGSGGILVQQQYPGSELHDLRMLCIDYKFVAAMERIPARVYGDGERTVRALIEQENAKEERGVAYKQPLAMIDMERAEAYLGEAIERVPLAEEEVRVLGISNYGAGGETCDVTDEVPEWLRRQAEAAARTCQLPVAGIDFLTAVPVATDVDAGALQAVLIEINKCPSLAIHDLPSHGKARGVVKTYVDYLERI